tara:strand:- start:151 stop:375 length:225 start_codon:yes stop_codon:yes gene_type:complete
MPENRTISYQEHYVQVTFFQSFIKDKELEIENLKKQLNFAEQSKKNIEHKLSGEIECLKAKHEVELNNNTNERS